MVLPASATYFRHVNRRTLECIGDGIDIEETRAWEGYWNEPLLEIAKQGIADASTLTVLLSGRSVDLKDTIVRIIKSRGLGFDLVGLKPKTGVTTTLDFKLKFLTDVLSLPSDIEEVVIYEDRPSHRDAFEKYLKELQRGREGSALLRYEVVFVELERYFLAQQVEEAIVLDMMRKRPGYCVSEDKSEHVSGKNEQENGSLEQGN
jgi:HAD domain family 1 in Swiss Army Knife RNA repair proteins